MSLTGVLFMLGFFGGCLMALARHPIYGLLAYVGAFYLHPPSRWWGQGFLLNFRWALLGAGITLVAIFLHNRKLANRAALTSHGIAVLFLAFILWLGIQTGWALDGDAHWELFSYYVKFGLTLYLIYKCLDTEQHLRWFLWAHVLGCFYFGWIAFTSYEGGRFEDFGGPGLSEANAGALTIATGILAASALFLHGKVVEKAVLLFAIPFIVNALVTTISRSGFLATIAGGLVFNLFTPVRFRKRVRVLSILAVVMFGMLTGPAYWQRINSIKQIGNEVEGVDTGSGRLDIMVAQLRMFSAYPMGCGATCTAVLSPLYLEDRHLTGEGSERARASHNTFFTMLVEHGLPGAAYYVLLVLLVFSGVRRVAALLKSSGTQDGFLFLALPALSSMLAAIFVCDLFASYAKYEVRIWMLAALMATLNLVAERARVSASTPAEKSPGDLGKSSAPQLRPDGWVAPR